MTPTSPSDSQAAPDPRNKYVGTEVKWIHAQRINGGDWKIRYVDLREARPSVADSRMMDETQIGEMRQSEFAIFRNRENWFDRRPRFLIDCRDKSSAPICSSLAGIINNLDSGWF